MKSSKDTEIDRFSVPRERRAKSLRDFARHYVYPLWRWYLCGAVFLALTNAVVLLLPRLARDLVNAFSDGIPESGSGIPFAIMALGGCLIVVRVFSRILIFWPGRRVEAETRQDLFSKIMRAPRAFLYRFGQGDLVSRIANDTGYLRILFAFGMLSIINVSFLLTMTVGAMLTFHAGLTLAALIPFVPLLFFIRCLLPAMHAASMHNQKAMGTLSAVMTEAFRGISSIRLHTAGGAFMERIDKANEDVYESSRRLALLQTTVIPVSGLMVNVAQAIVLLYGGAQVIAGHLQAGDIMVFNVYMASLAFPLAFSGGLLAMIERARSAHARIADVFDFPREEALAARVQPAEAPAGTPLLMLSSLSKDFKSEKAHFKIDDVSFSLSAGAVLGVCGPVGSGKSLLFDLILRFEEPPPGSVFFRGRDVLDWEPTVLRTHIACALQSARLLSDSIRTNLAFGLEREITDEEIYHALERACIADEVRNFPEGLDTMTGEKGMRLSGGQRQRLALARLFLRQSELYLLDDVFSAVDQKTEQSLIRALLHGWEPRRASSIADRMSNGDGRAALIISHRHSVLEHCDEILLISAGRLLDRGPYAELAGRHPNFLQTLEREGHDG